MAFTPDNLSVIVQPIGGTGIRFLSYRSDDSVATITGSGYFTRAASFGVRKYDLIFVMPIAGNVESYIVIISDINATTGNGTAVIEPAVADGSIGYDKLLPAIATLIQNALQPAAIGTTVQAYSENLDEFATVNPSVFALTLLDDADASAAQTTLGISTFVKTLLDDASASAFLTTLGISTFVKTLLDDADATTFYGTLGTVPNAQISATLTSDKAYRRGNILGTVSQSSGVPTGEIIEQATNANGSYVKYADGTLLCRVPSLAAVFANAARLDAAWSFPATFIDTNYVMTAVSTNLAGIGATKYGFHFQNSAKTTTVGTMSAVISSPIWVAGENLGVALTATGRWF